VLHGLRRRRLLVNCESQNTKLDVRGFGDNMYIHFLATIYIHLEEDK
jgi:hypothetical protein